MSRVIISLLVLFYALPSTHAVDIFAYTEPYRTIEVSAADSGVITVLEVKEGDVVREGQILAKMDVGVIEQDLNIGREQLKLKQRRYEKIKALKENGRASQDEFERAEAEFKMDQFNLKRLEAALERKLMRSPVDGVVSRILRDVSESVSASNPHVMTVLELNRLRVNMYLRPDQARHYVRGATETLVSINTREIIPATVEFVSPVTDAASNTVRVKFLIENPARMIKSGERVEIYDELAEDDQEF